MRSRKGKKEMPETEVNKPAESDYTKSLRVMRDFVVTFKDGTQQTVTANRFIKSPKSDSGEVTFEGTPDSPYGSTAYFTDVVSIVPVPDSDPKPAGNVLRKFTVHDAKDRVHNIIAERKANYGERISFFGNGVDYMHLVATFTNPISVVDEPVFGPSYHVADVRFKVNGHARDVERLVNAWAKGHGYKLDGLEVTQTQCPFRNCNCS